MSLANPTVDYYHVNRRVAWSAYTLLKEGDVLDIGGKSNPYFAYFETHRYAVPVTLPDGEKISSPAIRFLGAVERGEAQHPQLPRIANEIARHFVTYVRELIWEDVRRREFPHLPSRQRCFWLIPTIEGAKYWVARLECKADCQILKVQAQGRIHRANELYLLGDSEPMQETIQKARQYWLGIFPEDGKEEIIFEGRVKITQVIQDLNSHN